MTARGPRLILAILIAVAITVPQLRIAATGDDFASNHSQRHRPVPQQPVQPVAQVRDAQALAAHISTLKQLAYRSRAAQPLLSRAAHRAIAGTALSRLSFPLRC